MTIINREIELMTGEERGEALQDALEYIAKLTVAVENGLSIPDDSLLDETNRFLRRLGG